MSKLNRAALSIFILLFVISCAPEKKKPDVSQINVNIQAERFENDLETQSENISLLKKKYGTFFDLFSYKLVSLGTLDTILLKQRLKDFINDVDIKNIYADTKKVFPDFSSVNQQLTDAFRYYKYYFPEKIIPQAVTFISGFNYGIVATDSTLGIGIDLYLGDTSRFYPALDLPQFKIRKMKREYIAVDCMKGWIQTEWEANPEHSDLLSQMIYQGKIIYVLDALMPDAPDSIKTGYTQSQLKWCDMNEKTMWSFFIDKQLLFSTDQGQLMKFTNDGPSTNGFPKESPADIAQWFGWKIISGYMENFPQTSLTQLLNEQDYKKIFRDSKYKPKK